MINWQDRKAQELSSGGAEYVSPGRKPWVARQEQESQGDDTNFQPQSLRRLAKNLPSHPNRGHQYMHRIREKSRLIALDDMPQPRERERRGNQQQADNPMKPDHNQGRKPDWNRDQMQRAVYRMIVRAIVMRI